jgi:uncharacterized membrane protein
MSDLIVVAFPGEDTADQVLNRLQALQKEHLIDLEDACVVVRDRNGKVHVKQAVNLVGLEAASGGAFGAIWGILIGLLLLNPLAGLLTGAAFGAGAGAQSGMLSDYGINDDFIRSLGDTLEPGTSEPGTSALFVLVRRATLDKVLPEVRPFGGQVIRTSLSTEQEARLRRALEDVAVAHTP